MVIVDNKLAAELKNGSGFLGVGDGLQGSTDLKDGKWHHVAMLVDRANNNAKLYVDGVEEANVNNAMISDNISSSEDMLIGAERTSGFFFAGKIDDVRLWDIALTENDLKTNSTLCLSGIESDLMLAYNFEEGIGDVFIDITGNGNTGYITNADPETSWVTGVDNCGCSAEMTTMPTVRSIGVDVSVNQSGNMLTANATNATFQWMECTGDTIITGETNADYTVVVSGDYAVIVTQNNCTDTSACMSFVVTGTAATVNSEISIYPNPNNGSFYINGKLDGVYTIVNSFGQLVKTENLNASGNYSAEINNLENGVYFVVNQNDKNVARKKVVVTK